jgi:sugar O-acyltransferase (sialic acid O-acetyltransferase NeuD family)
MIKSLIGDGGHAKEVMAQMGTSLIRFVDDDYWLPGDDKLLPISKFNPQIYTTMIAIGNSSDRFRISKKLPKETKYFTYIHPTALLMNNIEIGEGSFIGAYSILTDSIKIGSHALLNRSCHIGHDCVIGDFFTSMPGSILSGDIVIDDIVYIGTNSCVREKIKICSNVTVGLLSSVVKNITEPGVYAGTPVKKIK